SAYTLQSSNTVIKLNAAVTAATTFVVQYTSALAAQTNTGAGAVSVVPTVTAEFDGDLNDIDFTVKPAVLAIGSLAGSGGNGIDIVFEKVGTLSGFFF